MIRNRRKIIFRKKVALYRHIQRKSSHHLVDNGFHYLKNNITFHEEISDEVKEELLQVFRLIERPFAEIIDLFEDEAC